MLTKLKKKYTRPHKNTSSKQKNTNNKKKGTGNERGQIGNQKRENEVPTLWFKNNKLRGRNLQ